MQKKIIKCCNKVGLTHARQKLHHCYMTSTDLVHRMQISIFPTEQVIRLSYLQILLWTQLSRLFSLPLFLFDDILRTCRVSRIES